MKLIGITLRRPGFWEATAAAILAVGLWLAALGLMHAGGLPFGRSEAGALLVVLGWGAVSARIGLRVGSDTRHLAVNLLVSAMLLALWQLLLVTVG
jgi:hypothetical protein